MNHKNAFQVKKLVLIMSVSSLCGWSPAYAQAVPTSAGTKSSAGTTLEEIIVTASKRAESLQNTPLTVSAVTGDELVSQGVRNVMDLGAQVPSLQITSSSTGAAQVFLRGVGSTNTTEVGDPAVAFHMDGIYIARATSVGSLFYDLERVEIVRGPQGTLYGRNATVGAINVITNKPKFRYESAGSLELGNYSNLITSGMVNVPLSEEWAVRAAFQSARHNGYQKAIAPAGTTSNAPTVGNDRYDQDDLSARVQALYEPSKNFSLLLRGDYMHQGGAGGGDVAYNTATPALFPRPYESYSTVNIGRDDKFWSAGAEANWDLGIAKLTYLTGYNSSKLDRTLENPAVHTPNYYIGIDSTWSHELRLSKEMDQIKWIFGIYQFNEKNNVDFRVASGANFLSFIQPKVTSDTSAAFGQLTWSATEALRLTAGARYNKDSKARNGGTYILSPTGILISTVTLNQSAASWSHFDWKLGVDYDLSRSSMLYATASTSYKAGGYFDGLQPNTYKPEEILAFEVGVKNRFLNNHLQLNADVFHFDYKDFQVSAIGTIAGQNATITLNADKAEIYGFELEGVGLLTDADRVDGTLGWVHARYIDFVLPLGDAFANNNANAGITRCFTANYSVAAPRSVNFNGCPMARAPAWTLNLGYEHTWSLASGADLTARVQTHYESAKNLEFHGFAENKQDSFTKSDIILTYTSPDQKWNVLGYVRNIEDEKIRTNSNPNAATGISTNGNTDFYAAPRIYGVRLSMKF